MKIDDRYKNVDTMYDELEDVDNLPYFESDPHMIMQRKISQGAKEITFDVFEKQFWNTLKKQVHDLKPLAVWTEINVKIKGSAESHLYPKGILPV